VRDAAVEHGWTVRGYVDDVALTQWRKDGTCVVVVGGMVTIVMLVVGFGHRGSQLVEVVG
jgi:hypothetical protein